MQKIIDLLIKENALDEKKLELFINRYGDSKVSITNLIKVRLIHVEEMEKILNKELRLQSIKMEDLESISGIDTTDLLKRQAKDANMEYMDIRDVKIDFKLIKRLPLKQLVRYKVLPLYIEDEKVTVASLTPMILKLREQLNAFFMEKLWLQYWLVLR